MAMLEATLGQLFLVIVVARIVGLYTVQMREGGENAYFCDGPSNHLKPYRNK